MNQTYELPQNLGDLMGAYDEAHWQTAVGEIKPGIGVLRWHRALRRFRG